MLDKYLKSRRRRNLSLDNINHFSAIADSLAFTIEQMAKIGEAYQATFPDQGCLPQRRARILGEFCA